MQKFKGFPAKTEIQGLPKEFFSELFPLIMDVNELKVTVFALWAMKQKQGDFRYLRERDFYGEVARAMHGLAEADIAAGLVLAVTRETLLKAEVRVNDIDETLYFAHSPNGKIAVRQIRAGRWIPGDANNPVEILPERPTIFKLYEDNIGSISPMIRDELIALQQDYDETWLEDAIKASVESNKRNLGYIKVILTRWEQEGRKRETVRADSQEDGSRYLSGKFGGYIKH